MKKTIYMFCFLLVISIIFSTCQNPTIIEKRPCSQANTKWVSEDKTIVFYVDDNYQATGTMNIENETVDFYMTNDTGAGMHIFPLSVLEEDIIDTEDKYEYWLCSFKNKRKFVATVKDTTYFEVGQEIIFYRIRQGTGQSGDGSRGTQRVNQGTVLQSIRAVNQGTVLAVNQGTVL